MGQFTYFFIKFTFGNSSTNVLNQTILHSVKKLQQIPLWYEQWVTHESSISHQYIYSIHFGILKLFFIIRFQSRYRLYWYVCTDSTQSNFSLQCENKFRDHKTDTLWHTAYSGPSPHHDWTVVINRFLFEKSFQERFVLSVALLNSVLNQQVCRYVICDPTVRPRDSVDSVAQR